MLTERADPWRAGLIALLVVELAGGVAAGAVLWSVWNMDFGDEGAGRAPSWSAGPAWLTAGVAVCAALWIAAIVLTVRNARAARMSLAVIAGLHLVFAAVVLTIEASDLGRALAVAGLLAGAALVATLAVFPDARSPGRR